MTFFNVLDDLLGISHPTQPKKDKPKEDFEKFFKEFFGDAYDGTNITAVVEGQTYTTPKEAWITHVHSIREKYRNASTIVILSPYDTKRFGFDNYKSSGAEEYIKLTWYCDINNINKKLSFKECWDAVVINTNLIFKDYKK